MELLQEACRRLYTNEYSLCVMACSQVVGDGDRGVLARWCYDALRSGAIPDVVRQFSLRVIEGRQDVQPA